MGMVSPQIQALFLPHKGLPPSCQQGLWGCKDAAALEKRIDDRLRKLSSEKSFSSSFRKDSAKLRAVMGSPNYKNLVGALAEIGKKYTACNLSKLQRGGQSKAEQQILFFEVEAAFNKAFKSEFRAWQSADPYQQSFALVVAKIVAASVGSGLSHNLRHVIRKSNYIKRL